MASDPQTLPVATSKPLVLKTQCAQGPGTHTANSATAPEGSNTAPQFTCAGIPKPRLPHLNDGGSLRSASSKSLGQAPLLPL